LADILVAKSGSTMETNMIERVAIAIWQANHEENEAGDPEYEFRIWKLEDPNCSSSCEVPEWERDDYRTMAKAAIVAMLGIND